MLEMLSYWFKLESPQQQFIRGVKENNPSLIEKALQAGANVETQIDEPLADIHGNTIPDFRDPLSWACMRGNVAAAECLLKYLNPYIDGANQTLLHWVSQYDIENALDIIKLLVKNGYDVNALDVKGENPLFWLVGRNGPVEIAKYFIESGAKVNIADPNGSTPLHLAISNRNVPMVRLLVEEGGADVTVKGRLEQTPIHLAEGEATMDESNGNRAGYSMLQALHKTLGKRRSRSSSPHLSETDNSTRTRKKRKY